MRSYRPEELFDENGTLHRRSSRRCAPTGDAAHGRQPARQRRPAAAATCSCRTSATTRSTCRSPAPSMAEATRVLGDFLRDVMKLNLDAAQLPRLRPGRDRVEPAGRALRGHRPRLDGRRSCRTTTHLAPDGRVMEILSEHTCQGWLEGYLLTGRHGLFSCYEAFIHIVDSMFNQHAKWLKVTREIPWRRPIASLNYLLTSHVWRQDHNGFCHQDPGLHRPRRQQEGRRRPRLSAAGRQHAALGRPTTACAAATTSTSSSPASSRRRSGSTWTRRSSTARPASASGTGRATTEAASPTW